MTGNELRSLRLAAGLTQVECAALVGYHSNYLARLERGEEPIAPRSEKLLRALIKPAKKISKKNH